MVDLYAPGAKLDGAWEKVSRAMEETSRLLASQGVTHLVFSVPQDLSLADSEQPKYFRDGAQGRALDFGAPYQRFAGTARESVWLDLHPVFARSYRPGLYFPRDPHWTPAGHRLAAESLLPCAKALIERARAGQPPPTGARCEDLAPSVPEDAKNANGDLD